MVKVAFMGDQMHRRLFVIGAGWSLGASGLGFGQSPAPETPPLEDRISPSFSNLEPPEGYLLQLQTGLVGKGGISDADREIADRIEGAILTQKLDTPYAVAKAILVYHTHDTAAYRRMLWGYPKGDAWPTNPLIARFHDVSGTYSKPNAENDGDDAHWCAAFINWCIEVANANRSSKLEKKSSWAASFVDWEQPVAVDEAVNGDLVVFEKRDQSGKLVGGHVGFYEGQNKDYVIVLGGNQFFDDRANTGPSRRPAETRASTIVPAEYLKKKSLDNGTIKRELVAVRRGT
jgi:uncharacterized protein (TIGR02594 family)